MSYEVQYVMSFSGAKYALCRVLQQAAVRIMQSYSESRIMRFVDFLFMPKYVLVMYWLLLQLSIYCVQLFSRVKRVLCSVLQWVKY